MRITRRVVQVALGMLWLLDGVLQLQPFMFTPGFAHQILAPAGVGQPSFVSAPVAWSASLIGAHPLPFNIGFALIQIGLGVGILIPRLARPALAASALWSFGVWYLGEGLGGLAGGHASPITGAPGAVLLYLVLAVAALPERTAEGLTSDVNLPAWIATAWAVMWCEFALLLVLPGAAAAASVASQLQASGSMAPGWLSRLDSGGAELVTNIGSGSTGVLAASCVGIGVAALGGQRMRVLAMSAGTLFACSTWALGQAFGGLLSGEATDPSTGPLLVLFGVALLGTLGAVRTRKPVVVEAEFQESAIAKIPTALEADCSNPPPAVTTTHAAA